MNDILTYTLWCEYLLVPRDREVFFLLKLCALNLLEVHPFVFLSSHPKKERLFVVVVLAVAM
jgi:hypothetical protein